LLDSLGLLKLAFLALIAAPCALVAWRFLRGPRSPPIVWGFALLTLAGLETAGYLIFGQFLLRLFFILGPSVALIGIWQMTHDKRVRSTYLSACLVVGFAVLVLSVVQRDLNETTPDSISPSTAWLNEKAATQRIITDLRTWGRIVEASEGAPRFGFQSYTSDIYGAVTGRVEIENWSSARIVLVNENTIDLPVQAGRFEWVEFQPIIVDSIDGTHHLSRTYDDGRALIYWRVR
jgi:hypothetical protein